MILDGDEDFTVIQDKRTLKSAAGEGGTIKYTKRNELYRRLNVFEKMNFAAYMTKYNVFDKKEYGEGSKYMSSIRKPSDVFYNPGFVIRRWYSALIFTSIALVILMITIWVVLQVYYFLGFYKIFVEDAAAEEENGRQRRKNLFKLILYCSLIGGVGVVINHFYEKTTDRIDIIQYYIK